VKNKVIEKSWHNETCTKYTVHVWPPGATFWRLENKKHRARGPSLEGTKEWWLYGKQLTEEEFLETLNEAR